MISVKIVQTNRRKAEQSRQKQEQLLKEKKELEEKTKLLEETKTKLETEKRDLEIKLEARKTTVRLASATTYSLPANEAKAFIYQHESGNNPLAVNRTSGACGLGQKLKCQDLRDACPLMDYNCQDQYFTNYMVKRYGTWEGAYQFWLAHRWW